MQPWPAVKVDCSGPSEPSHGPSAVRPFRRESSSRRRPHQWFDRRVLFDALHDLAGGFHTHIRADHPGFKILQQFVIKNLPGSEQVPNIGSQNLFCFLKSAFKFVEQSHDRSATISQR